MPFARNHISITEIWNDTFLQNCCKNVMVNWLDEKNVYHIFITISSQCYQNSITQDSPQYLNLDITILPEIWSQMDENVMHHFLVPSHNHDIFMTMLEKSIILEFSYGNWIYWEKLVPFSSPHCLNISAMKNINDRS